MTTLSRFLEQAEARCKAATKGPWKFLVGDNPNDVGAIVAPTVYDAKVCDFGDSDQYYPTEGTAPAEHDLDFILKARTDLPAALSLLKAFAEFEAAAKVYVEALSAHVPIDALQMCRYTRDWYLAADAAVAALAAQAGEGKA